MAAGGIVAHACLLLGASPSPLPAPAHVDPVAAEAVDVAPGAPTDRVRPGIRARDLDAPVTQFNRGAVRAPPPQAFPKDALPVPDRYRLADNIGIRVNRLDPYNQNDLKGDRPVAGTTDCFVACQRDLRHGRRAAVVSDPRQRSDNRPAEQPRRLRPRQCAGLFPDLSVRRVDLQGRDGVQAARDRVARHLRV